MKKKTLRDILIAARPLSRLCPVILVNTKNPEGDFLRVDHCQTLYDVRIYLRRYENAMDVYWHENYARSSVVISGMNLRKEKTVLGVPLDSEDWELHDPEALKDIMEIMQEDYDSIVEPEEVSSDT